MFTVYLFYSSSGSKMVAASLVHLLNNQFEECIIETSLSIKFEDKSPDLCYFIPYSYYKQNE